MKMRFFILLFLVSICSSAQISKINVDSLSKKDSIIWDALMDGNISTEEWHRQSLALGRYEPDIHAWHKYQDQIDILNQNYAHLLNSGKVHIVIPENYQSERLNGNKYVKAYLLNLSDSSLTIPRIDATIGNFSAEIFIDNDWHKFRKTYGSSCGNSYWNAKLESNNVIFFEFSNYSLLEGNLPYKIRIIYDHFGNRIVSNPIEAWLNANQIASILYRKENSN